ncbi:MAG: hypothetical protein AAF366_13380 [Pseudomonadota bacterium]
MGPAGAIHLPARDMLRFLEAHAKRDPGYLPPGLWERLHRPVGDYAIGWRGEPDDLRHTGSNMFWFAGMRITHADAAFVVVNAGGPTARSAVLAMLDSLP